MLNLSRKIGFVNKINIRTLSSLVKNQALINGQWTKARDNKQFDVINPANMEVIAQVPDMNKIDCERAIDAAHDAFYRKDWHLTTAKERSALLKVKYNFINFRKNIPENFH